MGARGCKLLACTRHVPSPDSPRQEADKEPEKEQAAPSKATDTAPPDFGPTSEEVVIQRPKCSTIKASALPGQSNVPASRTSSFASKPGEALKAEVFRPATASAAAFLVNRISSRTWLQENAGSMFITKVALALLQAGLEKETRVVLEAVQAQEEEIRIHIEASYVPAYPQLPLLWLCWAFTNLGIQDKADECWRKLLRYRHPFTDSGLIKGPAPLGTQCNQLNVVSDLFATGLLLKGAILQGDFEVATASADSLLRAITANHLNMTSRQRFNLRWTWEGFIEELDVNNCVLQAEPEQHYFMLAFPAIQLLEHSLSSQISKERRVALREAAAELLAFLRKCRGFESGRHSYVVAAAFAAEGDKGAALTLANRLIAKENPIFAAAVGTEAPEDLDLAADIVLWLTEVDRYLQK